MLNNVDFIGGSGLAVGTKTTDFIVLFRETSMTLRWRITPLSGGLRRRHWRFRAAIKKTDQNHIKVGVINGAEQDVAKSPDGWRKKYGLDVRLVGFSGSLLPNDATDKGELDANVFQHARSSNSKTKITAISWWRSAIPLSSRWPATQKIKSLKELPDGAVIAIPLDPTNGARPAAAGKNRIDYAETRQGLLPPPRTSAPTRTIANHGAGRRAAAARAGRSKGHRCRHQHHLHQPDQSDADQRRHLHRDKDSPYTNIIVTREDNKDAPNVQNFIKAYGSDEVAKAAENLQRRRGEGW